ncbi:hypothetical protein, conserved [Leishmania tarentolae]|uniref:methylated diphthine methylhydrolase n=1 Tax=Leishmania tarentolae TaxID=5689 RepID=A0A640K919_LEITA|nr:hypothetical protein, conserved [Leishmania tarentolae]
MSLALPCCAHALTLVGGRCSHYTCVCVCVCVSAERRLGMLLLIAAAVRCCGPHITACPACMSRSAWLQHLSVAIASPMPLSPLPSRLLRSLPRLRAVRLAHIPAAELPFPTRPWPSWRGRMGGSNWGEPAAHRAPSGSILLSCGLPADHTARLLFSLHMERDCVHREASCMSGNDGAMAVPTPASDSNVARYRLKQVASVDTSLTCNCLLAASLSPPSEPDDLSAQSFAAPDGAEVPRPALSFLAASYELRLPSSSATGSAACEVSDRDEAAGRRHVGECALYRCFASWDGEAAGETALHLQHRTSALPGVFDAVSVPSSFFSTAGLLSTTDAPPCIVLACTDGSVRVLDSFTLSPLVDPLRDLHAEMLTSCTALCCPTPHLLCSAHTGAVFLYSLSERCVTQELEGHEHDAWCTAMLPTGGWRPAASASPQTHGGCSDRHDTDGDTEVGDMPAAASTSALLASGGDDGYCKLYDTRTNPSRAVSRSRFDAGVVSITPVLNTSGGFSTAHATPYLLVGSYDESISLVDVRSMRRPVAQRGRLGGGVWRTSRCLLPLWESEAAVSDDAEAAAGGDGNVNLSLLLASARAQCHGTGAKRRCLTRSLASSWVNTTNVLVLPLMQRGAVLLPYDVRLSAEEVFGNADVPLTYFYGEAAESDSEAVPSATLNPTVTDNTLVYDAAVLRPLDRTGGRGAGAASDRSAAVVATVSFYERRIDVWTVVAGRPLL